MPLWHPVTVPEGRSTWWGCFLALVVAGGAWALATPLLAGPDEGQHAIRAAAEVRGEMGDVRWIGFGPSAAARAPEAYAVADDMVCASLRPGRTPDCAPAFEGGDRLVDVTTYEFRPTPAYYWVVGVFTLASPAAAGVYAMRLATVVLCAAFLASALASASLVRNPWLARAAVLVAATPMALYLFGQVNPNGVEVAAAACLWMSSQALARPEVEPDGRLVRRTGVALVTLVLLRGSSPVIAALAIVAAVVVASPARRRQLMARADARLAAAVGGVATLAAVAWTATVYADGRVPRDGRGVDTAVERTGDFLREAVGVFGSLDQPAPAVAVALWAVATVVVVAVAVGLVDRRPRRLTLCLGLVALGVPIAVDAFDVPSIGFDWQGRYSLPFYAGVVLVAAANARARTVPRWWPLIAVAVVVAHVLAFAGTAARLADGGPGAVLGYLWSPRWEPPVVPPVVLLVGFTAGVAAFVAAVSRRGRGWRRSPSTAAASSPAEVLATTSPLAPSTRAGARP